MNNNYFKIKNNYARVDSTRKRIFLCESYFKKLPENYKVYCRFFNLKNKHGNFEEDNISIYEELEFLPKDVMLVEIDPNKSKYSQNTIHRSGRMYDVLLGGEVYYGLYSFSEAYIVFENNKDFSKFKLLCKDIYE